MNGSKQPTPSLSPGEFKLKLWMLVTVTLSEKSGWLALDYIFLFD